MMRKWHELSQKSTLHVYYSDCRSLTDHVRCEQVRKVQDKRIGRESGSMECSRVKRTNRIDAGRQLADLLTKCMKPDYLIRVLVSGKMGVLEDKS